MRHPAFTATKEIVEGLTEAIITVMKNWHTLCDMDLDGEAADPLLLFRASAERHKSRIVSKLAVSHSAARLFCGIRLTACQNF